MEDSEHSQPRKRLLSLAVLMVLSLLMTISSGWYVRYSSEVVGNLCPKTEVNPNGFCYDLLPSAGLPISYWRDVGGISVEGKLGPEDKFLASFFVADWFFWFVTLLSTTILIKAVSKIRQQ
ncbi:hypothetical protein [Aliiroseovarius sp. 2305UL8-7]|uniref:hypothetical protein n=1 Tax=Aliiroseovarius conchicola TaxID=3121637 RepID=UPI0035293B8E